MATGMRSETGRRQAGRFAWHFLQMYLAMAVGMGMFGMVLAFLGIWNLSNRFPELWAVTMTVSMVIPMAAWMRYRMGHGWPRTAEMSAAMTVPIGVLVVLCLMGILPHADVRLSMPLMSVAMLVDMGYRWRDYAQHRHGPVTSSAREHRSAVALTMAGSRER